MEITERVYVVGRGSWGGHEPISGEGDCNIYLIAIGSGLALVDVGIGPNFTKVWSNIRKTGFDPKGLASVLMTHTHWDHARALPELRKRSKARLHAHAYSAQAVYFHASNRHFDEPMEVRIDLSAFGSLAGNAVHHLFEGRLNDRSRAGEPRQIGRIRHEQIRFEGTTFEVTFPPRTVSCIEIMRR